MQLLQREQLMEEGTQGEQLGMRLPQERQLVVRLPQGEQQMAGLLLRRQYEVQLLQGEVGEGEGTRLLLSLDHPPSCNRLTEIPAHPPGGTSIPHPR